MVELLRSAAFSFFLQVYERVMALRRSGKSSLWFIRLKATGSIGIIRLGGPDQRANLRAHMRTCPGVVFSGRKNVRPFFSITRSQQAMSWAEAVATTPGEIPGVVPPSGCETRITRWLWTYTPSESHRHKQQQSSDRLRCLCLAPWFDLVVDAKPTVRTHVAGRGPR